MKLKHRVCFFSSDSSAKSPCGPCGRAAHAESKGGVYVCMNTFLGFGPEYVEKHYRKTGQSVYLHVQRTLREKPQGACGGGNEEIADEDPAEEVEEENEDENFKEKGLEWVREAWLVVFPEQIEIRLPNIEELPAMVSIACDAVLRADPYPCHGAEPWDSEFRQISHQAENLQQLDNGVCIPPSGWRCACCDVKKNLWLNLSDGEIRCGRKYVDGTEGNGHALLHFVETGHSLAVRMASISPDGADVFSFEKDEIVIDPKLSEHLEHFGINIMCQKTQEAEWGLGPGRRPTMEPRASEWDTLQESGLKLKPVYGPGYTGLRNLGHSAYLSTVMQVLFSITEFQRRYVGGLNKIFDESPLDPTRDFNTQMAKLGQGLLSGQYSKPPYKAELIEQVSREEQQPRRGVCPRMFKEVVSCGHPEFLSGRQQDAAEFLKHIIVLIEASNWGLDVTSRVFCFRVEERIQCCQSRKVKYRHRMDHMIHLPVPPEAALNKDQLLEWDRQWRGSESGRPGGPGGPGGQTAGRPRARIPFGACLQAFAEPENVDDFWSSELQARAMAVKSTRFATFPDYLIIHLKKFTFGQDWIPQKVDVSVDMPDELDITKLKGVGLRPGEKELPDIAPPTLRPTGLLGRPTLGCPPGQETDTALLPPGASFVEESIFEQLLEMGFPKEACRKALYYSGGLGIDHALDWIFSHMDESDFAEPLVLVDKVEDKEEEEDGVILGGAWGPKLSSQAPPPEESVALIVCMGFTRQRAFKALQANNNNLERATNWLLAFPSDGDDDDEDIDAAARSKKAEPHQNGPLRPKSANRVSQQSPDNSANQNALPVSDGPGRYRLFAFISHMGPSAKCGHYVCHVRKEGRWVIYNDEKVSISEKPPKDLGYLYFYKRICS
uniref:ubiquitinyl hydrolase 1 n=1 Tax=Eptatretus burgeri TaxID=7764 RepID=A0A8C4QUX2_EPTBU